MGDRGTGQGQRGRGGRAQSTAIVTVDTQPPRWPGHTTEHHTKLGSKLFPGARK